MFKLKIFKCSKDPNAIEPESYMDNIRKQKSTESRALPPIGTSNKLQSNFKRSMTMSKNDYADASQLNTPRREPRVGKTNEVQISPAKFKITTPTAKVESSFSDEIFMQGLHGSSQPDMMKMFMKNSPN